MRVPRRGRASALDRDRRARVHKSDAPACLTDMSMTTEAEDPPPEAGKLPTGRIARTARVGGLVTGQGVRWAGMRTANRVPSPERAAPPPTERSAGRRNQLS